MTRFSDMIAVVTGASRGIGREVALGLAGGGARVVVGYRTRRREAEMVLAEIRNAGGEGEIVEFDVRDGKSTVEIFQDVVGRHGGIDILVNNAGVLRDVLYAMMSPEEWDQVLAVNLTGVHNCCRAVLPRMMARRKGTIVNMASLAGIKASVGQANYAAAKGGVIALTKTLAAEAAPKGVRINCVVPGLMDVGMTTRLDHRVVAERRAHIPLGRLGTAEEAAQAVIFLASDDAGYMVGQTLVVDGGLGL